MESLKIATNVSAFIFIIMQTFYWGALYGNNQITKVKHTFFAEKVNTEIDYDLKTKTIKIKKLTNNKAKQ